MDRERLTKGEVSQELKDAVIKRLENNTFEITYPSQVKAIRYHHTDVITFQPNGDIILNSDGWLTPTTKERMNNHLPAQWHINQINKVWYLANNSHSYTFQDGITIHNDGTVSNAGVDPQELLRLDKRILKYVDGYIKALFGGKIEKPSSGDCWYCVMRDVDSKRPLGECIKDTDHIISHFDEKYYVPSLLMNAIEAFPISKVATWSVRYHMGYNDQISEWSDSIARIQIKSSLRRYLRRQLGLAS
jgi:hypothetical protein